MRRKKFEKEEEFEDDEEPDMMDIKEMVDFALDKLSEKYRKQDIIRGGRIINRISLDNNLESEVDSYHGELEGYARETGKMKILQDMLNQSERLYCEYGSGKCILSYWNMERVPPIKLSKCLKAIQVGETKTPHGRTKRLTKAGCKEPNYSIWSKSWKCKYANGKVHRL